MEGKMTSNGDEEIKLILANKPSLLRNIFRKGRLYFFQFFMLFLAVTAGFFAENLREEDSERKQSREYADSMIDDLIRDTLNIRYHLTRLKAAVKTIHELANYVRDKRIDELKNIDLYRFTLITPNPPFRWSRATLEQIKSSGSLRYFTNDSVVYYISQYDAISLHLDQDNFEDQQRYLEASKLKSRVVDLNYTEEFGMKIKSNFDSLMQTSYYARMVASHQLLTSDLNEVKSMVNAYLVAREFSLGRITELTHLIHDQDRLIRLLKREFKLE